MQIKPPNKVKVPKKEYKVKPTKRQKEAFKFIASGMNKRRAMLKAGYSEKSAVNAKQNIMETRGYQELIKEYRDQLKKQGVNSEVLAQVQAKGLDDIDPKVRLDYLRENKKDLGLSQETKGINIHGEKVIAILGGMTSKQ